MKNKYLEPEIEIIKLLTEDVVCTSGVEEDYTVGNNPDYFENGDNIPGAGGLS